MPISPSFSATRGFNPPPAPWMMGANNSGGLSFAGANLTMYGADGNPNNTNWGSWYPGVGNFCIETWAYCQGTGGSGLASVWTMGGTNVGINADLGLGLLNASPTYGTDNTHYQLVASLKGVSGTWGTVINDGTSDPLNNAFVLVNTWNHLAVTRNSGTLNLWVNGVLSYTTTYSTSITNPSTTSATIGMYGTNVISRYNAGDAGYNFSGYTRNTRYTVGNAVYTSTFTPPNVVSFLPPINGTYFKMAPVANSGNFSFDPGVFGTRTFINEVDDPTANYLVNSNSFSTTGDVSGYGPGIALYSA